MATKAELFQSVRDGSVDVCARILLQGMSVNSKDEFGNTPLHVAASIDQVDVARFLLQRPGIHRNATNSSEQTPLHIAVANQNDSIILALLEHEDVDINAVDMEGENCLHKAAPYCSAQIIQALLDRNANRNLQNKMGCTPLLVAITSQRSLNEVRMLYTAENVNLRDSNGYSPLDHAANMPEIATFLQAFGARTGADLYAAAAATSAAAAAASAVSAAVTHAAASSKLTAPPSAAPSQALAPGGTASGPASGPASSSASGSVQAAGSKVAEGGQAEPQRQKKACCAIL